eukprot:7032012-Pyramimonas_sp.AAC.1
MVMLLRKHAEKVGLRVHMIVMMLVCTPLCHYLPPLRHAPPVSNAATSHPSERACSELAAREIYWEFSM